jgi:hypothetical protein
MRALVVVLALAAAVGAHAQEGEAPPPPEVQDVPLPRWRPPTQASQAQFLAVAPEIAHSQKLRQAGLTLASIGFAGVLAGGIVWARAVEAHGYETVTMVGYRPDGRPLYATSFSPDDAAEHGRMVSAATALFVVGGTLAATGVILFSVGQARISAWHRERPSDALPPLSGY